MLAEICAGCADVEGVEATVVGAGEENAGGRDHGSGLNIGSDRARPAEVAVWLHCDEFPAVCGEINCSAAVEDGSRSEDGIFELVFPKKISVGRKGVNVSLLVADNDFSVGRNRRR